METILETILSFPGLEDTSPVFVNRALRLRRLKAEDESTLENDKEVNLVAADIYVAMANANDFTENKLSVAYSRDQFIKTASQLYKDNGEPEKAVALNAPKKKISYTGRAKSTW